MRFKTQFLPRHASNPYQLIAGLFEEARMHLRGLKRMVDLRGGITDNSIHQSSMLAAILTYELRRALSYRILLTSNIVLM